MAQCTFLLRPRFHQLTPSIALLATAKDGTAGGSSDEIASGRSDLRRTTLPQLDNTVRLPSSLGYQTQAPEAVLVTSHSNHTLILCCGTYTGRVCVERRNSD